MACDYSADRNTKLSVMNGSKGGRNQHLVALARLRSLFHSRHVFIGFATDGADFIDGVHGAYYESWVKLDGRTKLDLGNAIDTTNTYQWHAQQGTLITGPKLGITFPTL